MKKLHAVSGNLLLLTLCALLLPSGLPAQEGNEAASEAVARVLKKDAELSRVRNHASETGPIHRSVEAYLKGLEEVDFQGTPDAFEKAFRAHTDAWREGIPFLKRFAELRGEMHDVFDLIREQGGDVLAELERYEKALHGTWEAVEAAKPES